jgi:transposase, IS30 family
LKTVEKFEPFSRLVRTITYDNGKEFSWHELISELLKTDCYFATPYHSWERGLNEHTNGLVRQYFPKSTNLKKISEAALNFVAERLNSRPRKVLGYKTPKEVFLSAMKVNERVALQG